MKPSPVGRGRLSLVLPGYAPGAEAAAGTLSPALQRLLARAAWTASAASSTHSLLAALGIADGTSLAALLARAEFDGDSQGWLRADPVHFRADAKLVMLFAPEADELSLQEADTLLADLGARLPEFSWRRGADPRRWYARMPGLETTPVLGPAWLHGRSLTPFFPQDPAYRRWRQCMTEVQMVMHAAATNAAREARGMPPLNALWIWGGGAAPTACDTTLVLCAGRDLLLGGAAHTAGVAWRERADAGTLRTALERGDVLLSAGAPFGTREGPSGSVLDEANEQAGLAWALLCEGAAAQVELLGEGVRGQLTRDARWRIWQRHARGSFGDPHVVTAT